VSICLQRARIYSLIHKSENNGCYRKHVRSDDDGEDGI